MASTIWLLMNMEQSMAWELVGETKICIEDFCQSHSVHHKSCRTRAGDDWSTELWHDPGFTVISTRFLVFPNPEQISLEIMFHMCSQPAFRCFHALWNKPYRLNCGESSFQSKLTFSPASDSMDILNHNFWYTICTSVVLCIKLGGGRIKDKRVKMV
jgi:hypothetical protein